MTEVEDESSPRPGEAAEGETEPEVRFWSELTRVERRRRVGAAVVVLVHAACVLVTGAPEWIHDPLWPAVDWYADGLRMTNKWGMFAKPPRRDELVVIADRRDETTFVVETALQSERSLRDRIVDTRLRKVFTNLTRDENTRRYGRYFLLYYCREARRRDPTVWRVRLVSEHPAALDDDGNVSEQPKTEQHIERVCRPEPSEASRGARG